MKNIGIILAAGSGSRFKGKKPKQYMKLNGKELIEYSINAFSACNSLNDFICVIDKNSFSTNRIGEKFSIKCILGGETRNQSIKKALDYIKEKFPDVENIFIHEAARPFITSDIIEKYLIEIVNNDAIITAAEITDSLGKKNGEMVDRSQHHLIQAPECFNFNSLYSVFDPESNLTSTSHQLPDKAKIKYIYNNENNLKVTYPEDLFLAEQILKYKYIRNSSKNIYPIDSTEKIALIFGASGGVGSAVVKFFQQHNIKLLCPTRSEIDLEKLSKEKLHDYCGGNIPDIIINAAACSTSDSDGVIENYEKVFNVNLKSNLTLIEFAKELNKKINLVLISSSSSTRGRRNLTLYSASKAALNSVVESLSEDLFHKNIIINAVIPEKINTPLIEKLHKTKIDNSELLDVDDVVKVISYCSFTKDFGKLIHVRKGL